MSGRERDPFDFSSVETIERPRTPEALADRLRVLSGQMGSVAERALIGFGGDTAGSVLDRAGKVVGVAEHIPGLKKYARIAGSVVDIAGTAHGVAGQVSERGTGNYLRDVAKGALEGVGTELGVDIGPDGKRIIRKGKFAKGVLGLLKPKTFAGKMVTAAAEGARGAAMNGTPGQSAESAPYDWSLPVEYDQFGLGITEQPPAPTYSFDAAPDPFAPQSSTEKPYDPFGLGIAERPHTPTYNFDAAPDPFGQKTSTEKPYDPFGPQSPTKKPRDAFDFSDR
jgi:hypothetical protein